ncbi:MAG: hypothetical protein DMF63_08770 [Acidobacteria bacterium]|nr:MAG: hypothetical protein DMF63_08770 [Acidobacteriota bacterium]
MRILILILFLMSVAYSQPPIEPGVSQDLAKWRAARYSDVRYKLGLTLEKMSPVLKGTMELRLNVRDAATVGRGDAVIVLDWRKIKGHEEKSTISNVSINGRVLSSALRRQDSRNPGSERNERTPPEGGTQNWFEESNEHLIFRDGVIAGENVITLDFTSPILASGSAITRYIDKEDGSEYIYSLFVPSDASTAFPVFDQPDLKARFSLSMTVPGLWRIITNSPPPDKIKAAVTRWIANDLAGSQVLEGRYTQEFLETKPISTYVFAFAAGPWAEVEDSNAAVPAAVVGPSRPHARALVNPNAAAGRLRDSQRDAGATYGARAFVNSHAAAGRLRDSQRDAGVTSKIYVRKSQLAKFQPHAAEVFRLNREGIKFLEEYFDYKFPFPKYDIVLIPEFPFGGMEHAGATFLRESAVIFPSEPTANDQISRANVIFHEAAHQWFGDTVTMKWFDDLWLKEGFAEFMAYKTLERVMPQYNAWKAFYERNKPLAYATDSTKGTTPIYQEIKNLSAAKSAYGNIVYRKAPSFLRQAEFYLGPDKFQTAVRAFLKKHEYANAEWKDLVAEFETYGMRPLTDSMGLTPAEVQLHRKGESVRVQNWALLWVASRGSSRIKLMAKDLPGGQGSFEFVQEDILGQANVCRPLKFNYLVGYSDGRRESDDVELDCINESRQVTRPNKNGKYSNVSFIFPNSQDYGYGIFLLDDKSRDYVLKNIQNEKDDFLRSMMWGSLWDSVREGELDPKEYVELAIKVLSPAFRRPDSITPGAARSERQPPKGGTQNEGGTQNAIETDELTIQTILGRVSTAMTYYRSEPGAVATGSPDLGLRNSDLGLERKATTNPQSQIPNPRSGRPVATAQGSDLSSRLESMLIENMRSAPTLGLRITYYRAFLNIASSENARRMLKEMLSQQSVPPAVAGGSSSRDKNPPATAGGTDSYPPLPLKTKDRFDIVTKLASLNDPDAEALLKDLEKTETSDDAKRYAYAAHAAFPTKETKEKYWNDFISGKDISESWIESALGPFNSVRHADLTLPYLERALKELPNHKRNRKIFFVNGWLAAFIGGQKSEEALAIVNKFLADNPDLDRDLRLKILENVDVIERAVKIRGKFPNVRQAF